MYLCTECLEYYEDAEGEKVSSSAPSEDERVERFICGRCIRKGKGKSERRSEPERIRVKPRVRKGVRPDVLGGVRPKDIVFDLLDEEERSLSLREFLSWALQGEIEIVIS